MNTVFKLSDDGVILEKVLQPIDLDGYLNDGWTLEMPSIEAVNAAQPAVAQRKKTA
jgi:hypothetical protein